MVVIRENYESYSPPRAVRPSVERLLASLPAGNVARLEAVVLTNAATLAAGKTRRIKGRKYRANECLGFYHPERHGAAPWIEIVVDNAVGWVPAWLLRSKFLTDMLLAKTLFHEVGHHLETTIGTPSRSGEVAADSWSKILARQYFRSRYPLMSWLMGRFVRWYSRRKRGRVKS